MIYTEKYLLFTRRFDVDEESITASGDGFINPSYRVKFLFKDIDPNFHKYKLSNRYRFIPLILIIVLLAVSLLLLAAWHESIGEIIPFTNLVLLVIFCLLMLYTIFRKQWWIQYVNKSGVACFAFIENLKSDDYIKFKTYIDSRISNETKHSAQQGDAPEPATNVDSASPTLQPPAR